MRRSSDERFEMLLEKHKKKRRKGRLREEQAVNKKAWREANPEHVYKPKTRTKHPPGRMRYDGKVAELIRIGAENATDVPEVLLGMPIDTPEVKRARVVYCYSLWKWARCTKRELEDVYNMKKGRGFRVVQIGITAMASTKPLPEQRIVRQMIYDASASVRLLVYAKFRGKTGNC